MMKLAFLHFFSDCLVPDEQKTADKFIIFKSKLMELFDSCPNCTHACYTQVKYIKGSLVCIEQDCPRCHHSRTWSSQPFIQKTPAGNLLLSGAIFASGISYVKALRMLHNLGVATISETTFKEHAQSAIQPIIHHMC